MGCKGCKSLYVDDLVYKAIDVIKRLTPVDKEKLKAGLGGKELVFAETINGEIKKTKIA